MNNILSQLLASTILCGGAERLLGDSRLHHVEPLENSFWGEICKFLDFVVVENSDLGSGLILPGGCNQNLI